MQLLLLPLLGPLHLRYPALNTVTVRDVAAAFQPELLATTALTGEELAGDSWRDTFELALPLTVLPWARAEGLELLGLRQPSPDPSAEADFRRYAREMPALQERLNQVAPLETQLQQLLGGRLTLRTLGQEALPLIRSIESALLEAAGDGPATDWRHERARKAVARLLGQAAGRRLVLFAGLQELPALELALEAAGVQPEPLPEQIEVSEAARSRSLLDHALLAEGDADAAALNQALEQEGSAEAGYLRANLLLSGGDAEGALELLERVSHGDFSSPYFLPGWLLARLGQLRDLLGKRQEALMAYRGVLALSWAPPEAVEAAETGLEQPFTLPDA